MYKRCLGSNNESPGSFCLNVVRHKKSKTADSMKTFKRDSLYC